MKRLGLLVLPAAFTVLAVLSLGSSSGAQNAPRCNGKVATIVGTAGDDVLQGTKGRDIIVGLAGDDTIRGAGGNDLICGGNGDDIINGGAGNDNIFGGSGNDLMAGAAGRDRMVGFKGRDTANGGPGIDRCSAEKRNRCKRILLGPTPTTVTPPIENPVSPGAFCSPTGSTGKTSTGTAMVCSSTNSEGVPYAEGRSRWRSA